MIFLDSEVARPKHGGNWCDACEAGTARQRIVCQPGTRGYVSVSSRLCTSCLEELRQALVTWLDNLPTELELAD